MSEPREPSVQTSATVAHIGGGRSATLAAVTVALALGIVVWVGASNRPPAPTAPVPAAAASQQVEVVAVSTEPPPASTAPPPIAAPRSGPTLTGLDDVFAISVSNADGIYMSFLDELEPGHLSGEVHVPIFLIRPVTTVVFQQLLAPSSPSEPIVIGQWEARTRRLDAIGDRVRLIVNAASPADDAANGDLPRPTRQGFWLRAGIHIEDELSTFEIDVRVGPQQQLIGRTDGIFGPKGNAPDASQKPNVVRPAVDYPRDRGLYNRCRWDIAPYSGRPVPGTDEADC